MHAEEPEDSSPSLDDVVDILVGRMESHPEEFDMYGAFEKLVGYLEHWVQWQRDPDNYTLPLDLDFFSEEQKLRLWEGLRDARCKAFTAKVLEQVFKPQETPSGAQQANPIPQVLAPSSYYQHMNQRIAAQSAAQSAANRSVLGVLGDQLASINLLGENK